MAAKTVIIIDLKTDSFLDTINSGYQQLASLGASDIELRVTEDEAGYELNIAGKVDGSWKISDPATCPKPCKKCRKD